jgi:hypothetical protein
MLVLTEAVRGNLHGFVAFSRSEFAWRCGLLRNVVEN